MKELKQIIFKELKSIRRAINLACNEILKDEDLTLTEEKVNELKEIIETNRYAEIRLKLILLESEDWNEFLEWEYEEENR